MHLFLWNILDKIFAVCNKIIYKNNLGHLNHNKYHFCLFCYHQFTVLPLVLGLGGTPTHTTLKIGLSPFPFHVPHCFDPKMPILQFSCNFWPFCPTSSPTSRPNLGNPVIFSYYSHWNCHFSSYLQLQIYLHHKKQIV